MCEREREKIYMREWERKCLIKTGFKNCVNGNLWKVRVR